MRPGLKRLNEALVRLGVSTSSALKITKRVLRGIKVRNRCGTCRVFVETVSARATGATGGFVLSFPSFLSPSPRWPPPSSSTPHTFCLTTLCLPFSRYYPHPSFSPVSLASEAATPPLARGCDLKCKLKYSSRRRRANRFDINGASTSWKPGPRR